MYIFLLYVYALYFLNIPYECLINDVFYLKCVTNSFVNLCYLLFFCFNLSQVPDGCCMFRCSGLPAFRLNYL